MAVRYCPECRHELAGSGRFCLFCGCDLRKRRPVAGAVSETAAENRTGDSGKRRSVRFPAVRKRFRFSCSSSLLPLLSCCRFISVS